jgi:hypothetical protein
MKLSPRVTVWRASEVFALVANPTGGNDMTRKQQRHAWRLGKGAATLVKAQQVEASDDQPEFDTLGVVVDLNSDEGRNLAAETLRLTDDSDFRHLLSIARINESRYVIAAGGFNNRGLFGALCKTTDLMEMSFMAANARMDEAGVKATAWMFQPHSLADWLKEEDAVIEGGVA